MGGDCENINEKSWLALVDGMNGQRGQGRMCLKNTALTLKGWFWLIWIFRIEIIENEYYDLNLQANIIPERNFENTLTVHGDVTVKADTKYSHSAPYWGSIFLI